MLNHFKIAAGSILGFEHQIRGRNNQDSSIILREPGIIIGIVSDGCGSCPHSEVGSTFGCRSFAHFLRRRMRDQDEAGEFSGLHCEDMLEEARKDLLNHLGELGKPFGAERGEFIRDHLLFTLVGFFATPRQTGVFSIGDGVIGINGKFTILGPFPHNQPPYPAYDLFLSGVGSEETPPFATLPALDTHFRLHHLGRTPEIDSLFIGTDGVKDLMEAGDKAIPGRREKLGPIARFWEDPLFFDNPDAVRRRLALANSAAAKPNWECRRMEKSRPLLPDDTTLIVIRRN